MEHVEEDGKAMLYLVFEYLNQDLKHFMDETERTGESAAESDGAKLHVPTFIGHRAFTQARGDAQRFKTAELVG